MTEPVRISLIGHQLTAALPTGDVLSADDADALADLLFARGVAVDQVRCADWREGDAAPLVGQAVAIKSRLRALANGLHHPQDALSLALHVEAVKLMQADDSQRLRALAILDRWDSRLFSHSERPSVSRWPFEAHQEEPPK